MVKQIEVENELREVVARLINEVELSERQGRTDINIISEDAWIPILKEVYSCPNLVNLNIHKKNFPGVDLGDFEDRVCFQVTSTAKLAKVKKTLAKFEEHKLNEYFDEVYVFVLTKKQSSYSQPAINKVKCSGIDFDTKKHIFDTGDILGKISSLRLGTQQRFLVEFKKILGDIEERKAELDSSESYPYVLISNMCPVSVPKYVYSAVIVVDEKATVKEARSNLGYKKHFARGNTLLKLSLLLVGKEHNNWVYHENKVFTFINLDETDKFDGLLDEGTIEKIESSELYRNEHDEYSNLFAILLQRSTIEPLSTRFVEWDNKDKEYYFLPSDDSLKIRKEKWKGKVTATRRVYEKVLQRKDPSKLAHHLHFSCQLRFVLIGNEWFCHIKPGWRYTYNIIRKSRFHDDLLATQKRLELNHSVRDHTRFVAFFLKSTKFEPNHHPQFSELVQFECSLDTKIGNEEVVP